MHSPGSVTCWLDSLRLGDEAAAQRIWEGYFARLVGMARRKLRGLRPRAADEEDAALSAFNSFCKGAGEGRFPSPSFVAQVAEEYRRLFEQLDDEQHRIALLKMEGLTDKQIAKITSRSLATVERKLKLIRRIWQGETSHAG